jgi:tetratricopeptide (TPR) repeat protein
MRSVTVAVVLLLAGCASGERPAQGRQAELLNASGSAALASGRPQAAAARFAAAAELSAGIDDRVGLARDLHNRGLALAAAGEFLAADADLTESVRLADATAIPPLERAQTLLALAMVQVALGRVDAAQASVGRACSDAETDGGSGLRARAYASRAALAMRRGDLDAASRDLDQAATLGRGDPEATGSVQTNRGHLALLRRDPVAAQSAYTAAVTAFREARDPGGITAALEGSARAAEAAGDRSGAAACWRRAAAIPYGGQAARERQLAQAERLER